MLQNNMKHSYYVTSSNALFDSNLEFDKNTKGFECSKLLHKKIYTSRIDKYGQVIVTPIVPKLKLVQ